jgi:hypothetical protein
VIADCDRHVAIGDFRELFPFMTASWRRHFERDEFIGAIADASRHIWADDRYTHDEQPSEPEVDLALLLPHQGLTVSGWADVVAAKVLLASLNAFGEEHWTAAGARRVVVVSPHDPHWSAAEIRRRAESTDVAGVAIPLGGPLLGAECFDPIYDACQEARLAAVIHFSGLEGHYRGAQPVGGGVHFSAFSRYALLPQLAESNVASMVFEGTFERFPALRVLLAGFGFTWLPSFLWRLDREWRTFRHDVPWVRRAPSEYFAEHVWATTWPIAEAVDERVWARHGITDAVRERVVFGSHQPFGGDSPAVVTRVLGAPAERLLAAGSALLSPAATEAI